MKYIVSANPEEGERPTKTGKRFTLDGWEGQEEEEVRTNPTSRRQLERMHTVFRTTLLMAVASVPQFANLAITKTELDDWYDWFYGEDIAGRNPAPSESILLYAERNAWRKIHDMVHGGETLSSALRLIRQDLLFWQREVYERVNKAALRPTTICMGKGKGNTKSKGKGYQAVWQTQWQKPRKGESKSMAYTKPSFPPSTKGKNRKGKEKGKPNWPPHWAFKNPKGVAYCRDHLLYKSCAGQCGRSRNCPVQVGGWVCDAPASAHSPEECPHKSK